MKNPVFDVKADFITDTEGNVKSVVVDAKEFEDFLETFQMCFNMARLAAGGVDEIFGGGKKKAVKKGAAKKKK